MGQVTASKQEYILQEAGTAGAVPVFRLQVHDEQHIVNVFNLPDQLVGDVEDLEPPLIKGFCHGYGWLGPCQDECRHPKNSQW